jgi:hypothetical protein
VAGSCEYDDEPSSSGATELVIYEIMCYARCHFVYDEPFLQTVRTLDQSFLYSVRYIVPMRINIRFAIKHFRLHHILLNLINLFQFRGLNMHSL